MGSIRAASLPIPPHGFHKGLCGFQWAVTITWVFITKLHVMWLRSYGISSLSSSSYSEPRQYFKLLHSTTIFSKVSHSFRKTCQVSVLCHASLSVQCGDAIVSICGVGQSSCFFSFHFFLLSRRLYSQFTNTRYQAGNTQR